MTIMNALMMIVITVLDVHMKMSIAKISMNAQLTIVTNQLDALISELNVTTTMNVPETPVTVISVANTKRSHVTMATHVL